MTIRPVAHFLKATMKITDCGRISSMCQQKITISLGVYNQYRHHSEWRQNKVTSKKIKTKKIYYEQMTKEILHLILAKRPRKD